MSAERAPRLVYNPQDAAAELGVSRQTIYALMAAGELPSVKIGRCRRIRHEALVAYLDRLEASQVAS